MSTYSTYVYIAGAGLRSKIPIKSAQQLLATLLDEFCKMHNLDPDMYTLRKGKKVLDLSLPWRLSGLTAHTNLEIVKRLRADQISAKDAECTIALALQDGNRIVNKFSLDTNLWRVLLESESSANVPLTGEFTKEGKYLQPIVSYMNTAYKSLKDLEETKLSTLGLRNGQSCVLRLRHEVQIEFNKKDPNFVSVLDALRQQAQVPQTSCESTWSTATNVPEDALTDTTSQFSTSGIASEDMDENELRMVDSTQDVSLGLEDNDENMLLMDEDEIRAQEDEPTTLAPSSRKISSEDISMADDSTMDNVAQTQQTENNVSNKEISDVKIFMLDPSSASDATRFSTSDFDSDLEEKDFQLTPYELKSLMKDADEKKRLSQAFVSKDIKEKEQKRLATVYDKCIVRFRFANGLIAQATFKPTHTVQDLKAFVQEMVADEQEVMIYVSPPVQRIDTIPNLNMTLKQMQLLPAAILNVGLDRKFYEQKVRERQKKNTAYTAPTELKLKDHITQQAQVVRGMKSLQERTIIPQNLNVEAKEAGTTLGSTASEEPAPASASSSSSTQAEKKKIPKWLKL